MIGGQDGHSRTDTSIYTPQLGDVNSRPVGQVDALASWWTATIMHPGRSVEAVGLAGRLLEVARERNGSIYDAPRAAVLGGVEAIVCADPRGCFRQGYRDFNGRLEWEDRFIDVILNCENKTYGWVWNPSASSFVTVAQFHIDSWTRASAATGLGDPYNLYHVGAAVAYWSISIEHPGGSGGWPECW